MDIRGYESLCILYFDISFDNNWDDIFIKIFDRAYNDATKRKAFPYNSGECDSEKVNACKDSSRTIIKKCIECRYNSNENRIKEYDVWHDCLCMRLVNLYKRNGFEKYFSYGNAQKMINMTMKYLYILKQSGYSEFDRRIKINSIDYDIFHIPIDKYIINSLFFCGTNMPPKNEQSKINYNYNYINPSDIILAWSSWDKKQYIEVERQILNKLKNNNIRPLEWETKAWYYAKKYEKKEIKAEEFRKLLKGLEV